MKCVKSLFGYAALALLVLIALIAIVMGADWVWMRGTFCTDSVISKEYSSGNECESVAHRLENESGAKSVVCRCQR